jgi:O-antigen ligase
VRDCLLLYLAGFLLSEFVGVARGLSVTPWKARYLLWVPLFFLLFQVAYQRTRDFVSVATAVIAAAQVKGLLAIWVQKVAAPELTGGELAYATNHGDSILFTMAIVILLVQAMEGLPRALTRLFLLLPLPLTGMVLNRRRIAWAMLELSVLLIFFISSWRPWKRWITGAVLVGAPVVLLYLAVGWNSSSSLFGPVHKVRTMLDSSVDASTYWRDVETWNVASSIRNGSILGTGLGGEYVEYMQNDDISAGYPDYRRWPHNTVLGLLLFAGPLGFAAIWFLYPMTIFLAVRAYRYARDRVDRVAALSSVAAVVCGCVMAWGDTGLAFRQVTLAFALALAVAGKLSVSTGAWPRGAGKATPGPGTA